jgi:phage terminase small subunit
MAMTPKRARFCAEYLVDLNAAAAARRAGYSARTANSTGYELLQAPDVQAEIARLQAERAARTELSQDFVVRELMKVASQEDVTENAKVRALELLGKHQGMFVEKHEHDVRLQLTPDERARRVAALLMKGGAK